MMTDERILHIGIAPRAVVKARTIAIAKGQLRPAADEPSVWFSSFETLSKVLSERNMLLLEAIRRGEHRSLSDLARMSGRALSNLSRTLRTMERLGLVEMHQEERRKIPVVPYRQIVLSVRFDEGGEVEPRRAA